MAMPLRPGVVMPGGAQVGVAVGSAGDGAPDSGAVVFTVASAAAQAGAAVCFEVATVSSKIRAPRTRAVLNGLRIQLVHDGSQLSSIMQGMHRIPVLVHAVCAYRRLLYLYQRPCTQPQTIGHSTISLNTN